MMKSLKRIYYELGTPSKNLSLVFMVFGIILMIIFFYTLFLPVPSLSGTEQSLIFFSSVNYPILLILLISMFGIGTSLLGTGANSFSKSSGALFLYLSVLIIFIGITIIIFGIYTSTFYIDLQGLIVLFFGLINLLYSFEFKDHFRVC